MNMNDMPAPTPVLPGANTKRPCVLVVDDQPVNIQALYRIFSSEYQVLMATSGEKALAMCKDSPPDLVLLDVVMPGMDGHEVCARLKAGQDTRDIPVIFVTAHNNTDEETRGLELGAVDFIAKPISPPVVRARIRTHLTLKSQADLLRQMALIDGLTGVANRRCFDYQLSAEWRRAARMAAPIALLLMDVDYFKRYNDRYGHQAGDDCLRRVAAAIKSGLMRPCDLAARYGGEEFACILPGTDLPGGLAVAERLGQLVRDLRIEHAASDVTEVVTISIGVAVSAAGYLGEAATLLALADTELYRAKHEGRNRARGGALVTADEHTGHASKPGAGISLIPNPGPSPVTACRP